MQKSNTMYYSQGHTHQVSHHGSYLCSESICHVYDALYLMNSSPLSKIIGGPHRGCSDVTPILAKYALEKKRDPGSDMFAKYAAFKDVPLTSNKTSSSRGTTSKSSGSHDEGDREEGGGKGKGKGGKGKVGGRGRGKGGRGPWKNKKNTDEDLRNLDPGFTEVRGVDVHDLYGSQNPGVADGSVTYGVSVLTSDSTSMINKVEMAVDTDDVITNGSVIHGGEMRNGDRVADSDNQNTIMHIDWQSENDIGDNMNDVTANNTRMKDDALQNRERKGDGKQKIENENEIEENDLSRKRRKVGTPDIDSTLIKNTTRREDSQHQHQLQVEVEVAVKDENVDENEEDQEDRMVQCNECSRWVHALCEGIDQSQYEAMTRGTHPVWVRRLWTLDSTINLPYQTTHILVYSSTPCGLSNSLHRRSHHLFPHTLSYSHTQT